MKDLTHIYNAILNQKLTSLQTVEGLEEVVDNFVLIKAIPNTTPVALVTYVDVELGQKAVLTVFTPDGIVEKSLPDDFAKKLVKLNVFEHTSISIGFIDIQEKGNSKFAMLMTFPETPSKIQYGIMENRVAAQCYLFNKAVDEYTNERPYGPEDDYIRESIDLFFHVIPSVELSSLADFESYLLGYKGKMATNKLRIFSPLNQAVIGEDNLSFTLQIRPKQVDILLAWMSTVLTDEQADSKLKEVLIN